MSLIGESFKQAMVIFITVIFAIILLTILAIVIIKIIIPKIPWDQIIKNSLGL